MTRDEAVTRLLKMANDLARETGKPLWTRAEVEARPRDASWCGHALAARCAQTIEATEP